MTTLFFLIWPFLSPADADLHLATAPHRPGCGAGETRPSGKARLLPLKDTDLGKTKDNPAVEGYYARAPENPALTEPRWGYRWIMPTKYARRPLRSFVPLEVPDHWYWRPGGPDEITFGSGGD